jgi:hypothetical protein
LSVLTYTYLYLIQYSSYSPLLPLPIQSSPHPILPNLSQYSFYTCRYLHILIYIPLFPQYPKYLTPHKLSEWMVEVCRFY